MQSAKLKSISIIYNFKFLILASRLRRAGFTLVELILVMGILSMLLSLTFITLDPATRFAQVRNGTRTNDVNAILTSIHEYIVDNDGALPGGINTTLKQLGTCGSGGATACPGAAGACLDLSTLPLLAKYIKNIPQDSKDGTASTTKYSVVADANNIVTVSACGAELGKTIQVSR